MMSKSWHFSEQRPTARPGVAEVCSWRSGSKRLRLSETG